MVRSLAIVVVCAACGFTHGTASQQPDTGSGSGSSVPHKGAEVVSGAGRLTAGTITMDVQVGRAIDFDKTTAGTITISGAPVVKP
ncbi:MAG: hypothetical protein ACM31C_23950 [Acidobacteriota bacterium]